MDDLVKNITFKSFGRYPTSFKETKFQGKANKTFKVNLNRDSCILRFKKGEAEQETYERERWCAKAAMEEGVPTPLILTTGTHDGWAWSFQEFIEGTPGQEITEGIGEIWHTLGQYAKKLNRVPAPSIAFNYPDTLKYFFSDNLLAAKAVFSPEVASLIEKRLQETTLWNFTPMLCHGNLYPGNVIIEPSGKIHLVDWGTSSGNVAPHAELADLYTWNTGKENIALFMKGYGLEATEINMRDIQTLVLLRLTYIIRTKVDQEVDRSTDILAQSLQTAIAEVTDWETDILFAKNL